ncbi:MAG: nucleoside-diphosphate sugar epimerase/dehydratase [Aestuariivirga sp.]
MNRHLGEFSALLRRQARASKIAALMLADVVLLVACLELAYVLRLSAFAFPPVETWRLYAAAPALSVALAYCFGIYGTVSRSHSVRAELRVAISQALACLVWSVFLLSADTAGFPRSVVIIYLLLSIVGMISVRRFIAWLLNFEPNRTVKRERIPVLVFGAQTEGVQLASRLKRQGRYRPIGFAEVDTSLIGRKIDGLRVHDGRHLEKMLAECKPAEVIIARKNLKRSERRHIVDRMLAHNITVKTVPDIDAMVSGDANLAAARPVALEDLLGRDPVPPDAKLMEKAIKGKVVMVTGAGGSIGSELVRQVFRHGPKKIVMIDSSEFALFEIHREIEAQTAGATEGPVLAPILANVLDSNTIATIIREGGVNVVFHAAAYKHVRMVEENPAAGIRNNVWGTLNVAEAAMQEGVDLFVLISTDKAVRPSGVMGATKRVAEMVVQALASRPGCATTFAIVRFGNVLGSTGSVVPLFNEQIAQGGPVRVTHPEVTRYFMLIPEAAQLVIQASAMAAKGEVFVLDMGEPIKIVRLAKTMIELAGMTLRNASNPDGDIEIAFSGLRQGEKLFEELNIGQDISPTAHPRIMRSKEIFLGWNALQNELKMLDGKLQRNLCPHEAKSILIKLAMQSA